MLLIMLNVLMTIFIGILIPLYWKTYGPQNFLWLSDIGLFLTWLGLLLQSSLLISMACLGVILVEILWAVDFFFQILTGKNLLGIAHYMFQSQYSLLVRSFSLFHIFLPIIWFYFLYNWGYDARAFKYQTLLLWILLPLTYFLTKPQENINWVFVPKVFHWDWMPPLLWVGILMVGFPILIYWPSHLVLKYFFRS